MYYEKPRSVLRMQMFLLPLLLSASLGVHFLERHAKGNKQNMKIYRNVQSRLGGANYSKCIKNCMSRCLSDMLMSSMNMKGKKGKDGFEKSNLYQMKLKLNQFVRVT